MNQPFQMQPQFRVQQDGIWSTQYINVDLQNFGNAKQPVLPIITPGPGPGPGPIPQPPAVVSGMPASFRFHKYARSLPKEKWIVNLKDVDRVCGSSRFKNVAGQFDKMWKHPCKCKKTPCTCGYKKKGILNIYAIYNKKVWIPFDKYRDQVDVELKQDGVGIFKNSGKGNCVRRFHGTKQQCELGVTHYDVNNQKPVSNPQFSLCNNPKCAVCGIIRCGWQKKYTKPSQFNRLGIGCYFSATSSKANDYVQTNAAWKVEPGQLYVKKKIKSLFMGVCISGNVHLETGNQQNWTQPPQPTKQNPKRIHSVVGVPKNEVPNKTAVLNYDEICFYRDDAMYPRYLILYM